MLLTGIGMMGYKLVVTQFARSKEAVKHVPCYNLVTRA